MSHINNDDPDYQEKVRAAAVGPDPEQQRIEAFTTMVARHDLTYSYSDDHSVYLAGSASLAAINQARKFIPWPVARRIWNEAVDRKLIPSGRADWYWPEEEPK